MALSKHFRASSVWKPLLAGLVGGAAGTLAMGYYWQAVTKISGSDPRQETREQPGMLEDISVAGIKAKEDESSTAALGRIGYEALTHHTPSDDAKHKLSQGVHWTYGAGTGALYGALRARNGHAADPLGGAAYATLMWLGSELAVPLLGLSKGPGTSTLRQHAHGLGAHLSYGITMALSTQQIKHLLDRV